MASSSRTRYLPRIYVHVTTCVRAIPIPHFSKYDCTSKGAPSKGATFAGTLIGFSDFFSGPPGTGVVSSITYLPTVMGGG